MLDVERISDLDKQTGRQLGTEMKILLSKRQRLKYEADKRNKPHLYRKDKAILCDNISLTESVFQEEYQTIREALQVSSQVTDNASECNFRLSTY